MRDVCDFQAQDLQGLSPDAMAQVAAKLLQHIAEQSRHIGAQSKQIGEQSAHIASQAQAIKIWDAKIERITFELGRLKAWRFAARGERMNAEQRQLFEETLAADQASLEAQLEALQAQSGAQGSPQPLDPGASPNARPCPNTCSAWSTVTSPRTPPATVASRWCAWARTSARSRASFQPSFSCTAIFGASGHSKCCQALVQEPVEPHIIDLDLLPRV